MSISSERVNQGFCPDYDPDYANNSHLATSSIYTFKDSVESRVKNINSNIALLDDCTRRIAGLARILFVSGAMIGLGAVLVTLTGTITLSQAGLLIFAVSMAACIKIIRDVELFRSNRIKNTINRDKDHLGDYIKKLKYTHEYRAVERQFKSTDQSIPPVTYQIDEWSEPVIPNLDVRNNFKKIEISQWKRASNAESVTEKFRPWFQLYCDMRGTQANAGRAIIARYFSRNWSRTSVEGDFGFRFKGIMVPGMEDNFLSPKRFAQYMQPITSQAVSALS